ncbi:MAG: hypothetical protein GXP25_18420 [Planctomycetes bacterium]|nr:hypothetical protein [Planctomycetota bacterium]
MRYVLSGFGVFVLLWLASCEQTDKQTIGTAEQLERQGVAVRDVTLENQRIDKEVRRLKKELEDLRKLTQAQKEDIQKVLSEKGKLAEQKNESVQRIKRLQKERDEQAVALRSSTQTSDRLSRENERLRQEVDRLRKQLGNAKKGVHKEKEVGPAQNTTPQ